MANKKMKKILFFTNLPSPYRVRFFNLLGRSCDLHVMFELNYAKGRDKTWLSGAFQTFTPHFLKSHAYSAEGSFSFEVIRQYKRIQPDITVVCDISSMSGILLLSYLIRHKKPYYIEGDGAFNRPCRLLKAKMKQKFFRGAEKLFYTSDEHKDYYLRFGAEDKQLFWYPFSSISDSEIVNETQFAKQKEDDRESSFVFLSVGRFLGWKNFETAIRAFGRANIPDSKFVIVGGDPVPAYLKIIKEEGIKNIEFRPFMDSKKLYDLMRDCDCFVFPSLNDIWGLVINEAAANAMPIISSRGALSAVEMQPHTNGIILYNGLDSDDLAMKMRNIASLPKEDLLTLSRANLHVARIYTIEKMVEKHIELMGLED